MVKGTIFDIKEFAVHDGPGVRQTVFFKGCPLRCVWCHNPEGWEPQPQLLIHRKDCISCGACKALCSADPCTACGACVPVCPTHARRICGETLSARALAERLNRNAAIYADMGGGVTFSGGEPLMQAEFLLETVSLLNDTHTVLETCGYAPPHVFRAAVEAIDLILMDVKLVDPRQHRRFTGADNHMILQNLKVLIRGDRPFAVRIPLISQITDTEENLCAAAELLRHAPALQFVELLPYNPLAGAKYDWLGLDYAPPFSADLPAPQRGSLFQSRGIKVIGG